jgi:glyoxylase-like metal-dependent hydrolase (beta-lactamase superfamily II)
LSTEFFLQRTVTGANRIRETFYITTMSLSLIAFSLLTVSNLLSPPSRAEQVRITPIDAGMSWAFAIETARGVILIDAGSPGEQGRILRQLKAFSRKPLRLIVITHAHFDHYGSADALRQATGCQIAVHAGDSLDMANARTRIDLVRGWGVGGRVLFPLVNMVKKTPATRADFILQEGDRLNRFGLDARILHTPGHTPGSCSVLLADGSIFVSDLLVSSPRPGPQCYYAVDWEQIHASLRKVQALKPSRIYCGHQRRPLTPEQLSRMH